MVRSDNANVFRLPDVSARAAEAARPGKGCDGFLNLSGVSKHYGIKGGETVALASIDLAVRRGEFMTIIGPSGCGKSTLLQIAAGLIAPSSGTVLLDGQAVSGPPRQIVYLFQQYTKSLFPWRNVRANVAFALERKEPNRRRRNDEALSFLEMVGLRDFAEHYPWQLSGGMQQRVAIARALAAAPSILLMDEPFSSVDALTRMELQALVLDVWQKRDDLTIVFVTHDVEEAVYLSDRIAVLGRRPSKIERVIETGLPRPRHPIETRENAVFLRHRHELLNILLGRADAGS